MNDLQPKLDPPSDELTRDRHIIAIAVLLFASLAAAVVWWLNPFRGPEKLLHVSFDVTREFYKSLDAAFLEQTDSVLSAPTTMHAGSVRQARALAGGLVADVVSLASTYDLEILPPIRDCIAEDWREKLPNQSSPFYSTISFVVRAGNPKRIREWTDLSRSDVSLAVASPDSSGGARWAYLAFYAEIVRSHDADEQAARQPFIDAMLRVHLLEGGARTALALFQNRSNADVYLTWECDALRLADLGFDTLEAVFPSRSILIEPRIAALDCHTLERGTAELARSYLLFHYTPAAQRIAVEHRLRPVDPSVAPADGSFPATELYSLADAFGEDHETWRGMFGRGGLFPHIQTLRKGLRGG